MRFSQAMRQLGRAVAYYPELAKPLGGATAAILFCQLFYWQDKTDNPLGVYKTLDELMAETGLTERELRSAREKLRELGVVVETHKRLEHKLYFRVDFEVFDALMASFGEASERYSANGQNVSPRNDKTSFGEVSKCHSFNTLDYIHKNTTQDISPLNPPKGEADRKRSHSAENLQAETVDLPEYVNRELWVAYCKMRKAKRAPIKTEKTLELCLKDLERFSGGDEATASAVLNQSIKNTWTGLFALKTDAMPGKPTTVKRLTQTNFADKDYGETKLPEWAKD